MTLIVHFQPEISMLHGLNSQSDTPDLYLKVWMVCMLYRCHNGHYLPITAHSNGDQWNILEGKSNSLEQVTMCSSSLPILWMLIYTTVLVSAYSSG